MEFALIAPVMFILLTGSYDITQLLIARQQVISTAQQIVEIATELSIQPNQTTSLTINQAYQAETAIYALMPRLKSGSDTNKFSVTLSAAVFTATPQSCTRTAAAPSRRLRGARCCRFQRCRQMFRSRGPAA